MQLSVNGLDTFVATGGREFDVSQPTIVLLHGAGFDHTTWALHSRWFAHHGYGVLAPDLPGHGRSAGAPHSTNPQMAHSTPAVSSAVRRAPPTRPSPRWPTGPRRCSTPPALRRQGLSAIPWDR